MKKYLSLFLATIMLSATLMGCTVTFGEDDDKSVDNNDTENTTLVAGDTFIEDDIEYTLKEVDMCSSKNSQYTYLIRVWFDATNKSDEPQYIMNNMATFFAPDGVEAEWASDDDVPASDLIKTACNKQVQKGIATSCVNVFQFTKDGEYTMRLESGKEFKFNVEGKAPADGGVTITYPSTDGDKVYQQYPTN